MGATKNRAQVGVLGASGYTGAELVRLLSRHPEVELRLLTAERHAGEPLDRVFPHLGGLGLPNLVAMSEVAWADQSLDVVFCALPHGTTQEVVASILDAGANGSLKVIDLSADFRLEDPAVYETWYGKAHAATALQAEAVYGLSELDRERIRVARQADRAPPDREPGVDRDTVALQRCAMRVEFHLDDGPHAVDFKLNRDTTGHGVPALGPHDHIEREFRVATTSLAPHVLHAH